MPSFDAHPIAALTARLAGGFVERGRDLPRVLAKITGDVKLGPALHHGEVALAALLSRYLPAHRSKGWHAALVLSDRRIYGSIASGTIPWSSFDLPLAHVTDVRAEGALGGSARVFLGHHSVTIPIFGSEIVQHLRSVLTLPPATRTVGPLVIAPRPGDPVGAHSAAELLSSGDARTLAIPTLVFELARRGHVDEGAARGLLERAVILDRARGMGRPMNEGRWLSTLPRGGVRSVLCASLGDPEGSSVGPGWELHDFAIDRGGRSRGAALALSTLGLASAATLGIGFVVRPSAGLGLDRMRVTLADVPCGTSLELRAIYGGGELRLPFAATDLLQPLFATLASAELRGLLAEIAYAGRIRPEQQTAVPRADLEAALAALGGRLTLDDLYEG